MPCDTVRTIAVDFGKCNQTTLLAALTEQRLGPWTEGGLIYFGNGEWINTATGESRLASMRNVSELRAAYSTAVMKQTATRFGWKLKQTGPNQYVTQRR